MSARLEVRPGAVWLGLPVSSATRMPDGRVAVSRPGTSTVLVNREDLELALVIDGALAFA